MARISLASRVLTPPAALGLFAEEDLIYDGAFKLPASSPIGYYSPNGLYYWPARDSLLLADYRDTGNGGGTHTGEVNIISPSTAAFNSLPRTTQRQANTDILRGKSINVDGGHTSGGQAGARIGSYMAVGNDLWVSVFTIYDGSQTPQTLSHFKVDFSMHDFSNLVDNDVTGPFRISNGLNEYSNNNGRIGGFVSNYMCEIPAAYQSALGGTHLTGNSTISILARTSAGPACAVWTPADVPSVSHAAEIVVLGYPNGGDLDHQTLGAWGSTTPDLLSLPHVYNGCQFYNGMCWPTGTRTVLFFGTGGEAYNSIADNNGFCYGQSTADTNLHRDDVPGQPGQIYCYNPYDPIGGTGPKPWPCYCVVFAYDADDLVQAKLRNIDPWDVTPYAVWKIELPYWDDFGPKNVTSCAHDPVGKRIWIGQGFMDDNHPVIHQYHYA